jgi:hypothetical protein
LRAGGRPLRKTAIDALKAEHDLLLGLGKLDEKAKKDLSARLEMLNNNDGAYFVHKSGTASGSGESLGVPWWGWVLAFVLGFVAWGAYLNGKEAREVAAVWELAKKY